MTRPRLAWALFSLALAGGAVGIGLQATVPSAQLEASGGSLVLSATFVLVLMVFGLIGAVVAARLPDNPVGWLFLGLAVIEGVYELAIGYTFASLRTPDLPGTAYTAWLTDWLSPVSPALVALAFLLFPDGRLISRRWRPMALGCVLLIVPVGLHYALVPGPTEQFPAIDNPLAWTRLSWLDAVNPDYFIVPIFAMSVVGTFVRFRRSTGVERLQLKWFTFSAGLMSAYLVAALAATTWIGDSATASYVGGFFFALILCGLPVSAGIAMLRYRLYDIDVVINRTLVYGALTAMLVAAYLGSVLVFRLVLSPVTGESQLAVAGSTLAVAALFRPLRSRIQSVVDRRFYRSRYDATRTLEGFGARLRDELDLDALGTDLRTVVTDTMAPAHVSLWLRQEPS